MMDTLNIENITIDPNEQEIERYPADGVGVLVVDCGDGSNYYEHLHNREIDTTIVPPKIPLSLYKQYEPLCIVYSDGDCSDEEAKWRRSSMEYFIQKIPIVAVGDSKKELLDILGNATTDDNNNTDLGLYTFDSFDDDSCERVQYLAVHFNMQDNTYWDAA